MAKINVTQGTAGAYGAGELQLQNKAQMDGTLRIVTDNLNTASPLKLSTALVQSTSTVKITTSDVAYIDAEDNSGNNRFTVSRAVASQLVTVDFASVPTALTTPVGAIRTATDGVNLANVMTFLENGNKGMGTDTPNIYSTSSATNIVSIQASGTNQGGILDIAGTGTGFSGINIGNDTIRRAFVGTVNGSSFGIYTNATDTGTNVTERLTITSAGNVGIGTTSPVAELQVNKASDVTLALSNSTAVTSGTRGSLAFYNSAASTVAIIKASAVTDNVGTQLEFYTRPAAGSLTQTMTIDSTGNVGIGTASPTAKLQVTTNADVELKLDSTAGAYTSKLTLNASGGGGSVIDANGGAQPRLLFQNNGTTIASITSGGLCFGTDTAAANALDDYEEGTWTMGLTFGGASVGVTYNANTGSYTKIGRQVTLTGAIFLTSKGTSIGEASVTGFPFAVGSGSDKYASVSVYLAAVSFINQFEGYVAPSTSKMDLRQLTSLGVESGLTNTDFTNTSAVLVNVTYYV